MKWGVRRYQNKDGSLTAAGKKRYSDKSPYEVETVDGDTFVITGRGADPSKYNIKNKSKVVKTWGEHLYEIDHKKQVSKQNSEEMHQTTRQLHKEHNQSIYGVKGSRKVKAIRVVQGVSAMTVAFAALYKPNTETGKIVERLIMASGLMAMPVASLIKVNMDIEARARR